MRAAKDTRKAELAKIHIGAEALGMDTHDKDPNSDYRSMLWTIGRVRSAADLDHAGRRNVLDHLKSRGFIAKRAERSFGRKPLPPSADRAPMLEKIRAQLESAGRDWKYVNGIARRMFRVDDVNFCTPDQLRKIVAALNYDAKRRARKQP